MFLLLKTVHGIKLSDVTELNIVKLNSLRAMLFFEEIKVKWWSALLLLGGAAFTTSPLVGGGSLGVVAFPSFCGVVLLCPVEWCCLLLPPVGWCCSLSLLFGGAALVVHSHPSLVRCCFSRLGCC